jgi:AcrR family transcriptional regulator
MLSGGSGRERGSRPLAGEGEHSIPTGRKAYASAQINERRARILTEALALIVETGSTGFTVQALSRRADVAPRTLYYAFGDKEGVIESAVIEHFSALARRNGLAPTPPYAPWVMRAMDVALGEILRVPTYARAMVEVYFSPSANNRIVCALRKISDGVPALWLSAEAEAGHLWPWVDTGTFLEQLSDLQYATLHAWAVGELCDAELGRRRRLNFLTLAQGILNAPGRQIFEELLRVDIEALRDAAGGN